MHKEILTQEQAVLLPLLKRFSNVFGLVGGTAIALHVGHRHSIDFDLFSEERFGNLKIKREILKETKIEKELVNQLGEYTVLINKVKITFFQYPFKITYSQQLDNVIKIPDLLTLAAMKAYSLGMRAKWKDYVDLYFIMKDFFSFEEIAKKAKEIFAESFNEKLFRVQLAYFKDIDYTEEIIYLKGFKISDSIIKRKLVEFSLS